MPDSIDERLREIRSRLDAVPGVQLRLTSTDANAYGHAIRVRSKGERMSADEMADLILAEWYSSPPPRPYGRPEAQQSHLIELVESMEPLLWPL